MHRSTRLGPRALLLAVGVILLVAAPAGAHPFVAGGEAPVDSLASLRLTMSHGCGTEDAGGGDPTVEVALQVGDEMRIVEVPDVAEYEVALERDADGRVEVVTWTATGDGVPAPELPFDAVFSGEPGTEIHLRVFQGCEGFTYRWVGTPDDPAEDPAVALELTAADPDNPAPPPDEGAEAEPDGDAAGDGDNDAAGEGGDGADGDTVDPDAGDATDEDAGTAADTDTGTDTTADTDEAPAATDPSDGGPGMAILLGVVLLAVVVGGVLLGRRIRGATGNGAPDA